MWPAEQWNPQQLTARLALEHEQRAAFRAYARDIVLYDPDHPINRAYRENNDRALAEARVQVATQGFGAPWW